MIFYEKDKYVDLSEQYPNIIKESKIHVLPLLIVNFAIVDIFLTEKSTVVVESQHSPIRWGRHCGSRIHLGSCYGKVDYNPKLIWDGKEWHLNTFGTFLFAEMEFNVEIKNE